MTRTRRTLMLLAFVAPAMLAGKCESDTKDTGETGDTDYQGARVENPDQGWRLEIEEVDWDAPAVRHDTAPLAPIRD